MAHNASIGLTCRYASPYNARMKQKARPMYDKLFSSINLPVKPAMAVTGAAITLIQEPADEETAESFFGGYAENSILDDMGVDVATDVAVAEAARK